MIDDELVAGFHNIIRPVNLSREFTFLALNSYLTNLHQEVVSEAVMSNEDPGDFTAWWLYSDDQRMADLEEFVESILPYPYRESAMEFLVDNIPDELTRIRKQAISSVKEAAIEKPTYTLKELRENIKNWKWRVSNLYKIVNKQGKVVTFRPNPTQMYVLKNLHPKMWIVKSRQHGITTLMGVLGIDMAVFNPNKNLAINAHNLSSVRLIFKTKVEFPYNSLPIEIRESVRTTTKNVNELALSNNSMFYVTVSARSGTLNFVLVTELGILYWYSPAKAEEVVSGTLEALHKGSFGVVESTPYGLTGFYDKTMKIKSEQEETKRSGKELNYMQYKFLFLPWYLDPDNKAPITELSEEEQGYYKSLEFEQGITLTEEQKSWHCYKRRTNPRALLWREHPSTVEEAFKTSAEGAFFAEEVAKIYSEGRVVPEIYDPSIPVRIAWDLGVSDLMVLVFFQVIRETRRVIHVYSDSNRGLEDYIRYIEKSKYKFRDDTTLIFPHDIQVRDASLKTGENRLSSIGKLVVTLESGYKRKVRDLPIQRVSRPKTKIEDIDMLRAALPKWEFVGSTDPESSNTKLLRALASYRRKFNHERGVYEDQVYKDIHSHFVDALMVAESSLNGRRTISVTDLPF